MKENKKTRRQDKSNVSYSCIPVFLYSPITIEHQQ